MKLYYSTLVPLLALVVVAPSTTLAQNCGDKGKVETEIRYDGNPEANQVVFTQSGAPSSSRDTFVLKGIDDNAGLNGATKEYSNCFEPRSLYAFNLKDLGSDGIQNPGFFQVTANGRQVLRDGPFEFDQYNAFFSLDKQTCGGPNLKRFALDLTFDNFPSETTWSLKLTANNGEITSTVLDHTSSLPDGETTYRFSEFSESTLYVDACITPGDFVFIINDSANDGMSGQYKIYLEGEELPTTGNGKFMSTWQETFSVAFPPPPEEKDPDPPVSLCFPATAMANVQDKGPVAMRDLKIGDMVQTDSENNNNTFERIYSFGHYAPEGKADFVTITATSDDKKKSSSLELSPDHMVLRGNDGASYVRASMLTPGDILRDMNGNDVTIQSISSPKSKTGIYAPFTPSGKIIVNGIQTSAYSDILSEHSSGLVFGFFSFQWIAHSFEFPHRVACHYWGRTCPAETYTAEGVSTWMAAPRQAATWLLEDLEQYPFLQTICMTLFLTTMVAFHVVETILFSSSSSAATVMIAAAVAAGFALSTNKKKKLDYY